MTEEANLRSFIGKKAKETATLREREQTPDIRQDGDFANTPFRGGQAFEREEPPKDHMRRYWRQYETTPIVREPINNFARQVIEPGYWVWSEELSEDEHEELYEWLQNAAIIEKEPDKDIRALLRKAIVQREVRGTTLLEKVYAEEDNDTLYGLSFLNAETVRPNSRPGSPMLLLPDDTSSNFDNVDGELPKDEDGNTAAYTQYTTSSGFSTSDPNSDDVNNFSIDDVIKLTRDADVNEAFGTSRLEACSDTIEGLKQKMRDQNEAIASKAYPLWLFLFGTEEQPWDGDDINAFMNAHEMDEFHPGLKQGVRGDVSVETISGEVADIVDYLEFDINYIMSSMPLPKYALGAFESNINQFVSRTQERNVNRQIKEARRELESELTPVVREKAKEIADLSEEDLKGLEFKIGRPGEEMDQQDPNENTINYQGQGNSQDDEVGGQRLPQGMKKMLPPHMKRNQYGHGGPPEGSNGEPDDPSKGSETTDPHNVTGQASEPSVWDVNMNGDVAELADPRLVSTRDVQDDLAGLVEQVMLDFRDRTIDEIRREYQNAPYAASMAFEGIANTELNRVLQQSDFTRSSEVIMQETVERTLDTLEQDNQEVDLETFFGPTHQRNTSQYARSTRDSTRDALEELTNRMDNKLEVAANNGEELDRALERLQRTFSDAEIRRRSRLIAHMELQNAIESTKLTEFEQSPDVDGVKVINPCNQNTTPLCRNLGGCGPMDGAVASFDSNKTLSEQWEEQAPAQSTFNGFTPLPPAPPFHFGCRSELIPASTEELEEAKKEKPVTDVADLEEKYGVNLD